MAGRRKRPQVPEESRKRVARACEACRRVKEKCEGGYPCARCKRLNRPCHIVENARSSSGHRSSHKQTTAPRLEEYNREPINASISKKSDRSFEDERIAALQDIVENLTGCKDFSQKSLNFIRQSLSESGQVQRCLDAVNNKSSDSKDPEGNERTDSPDTVISLDNGYTGNLSHREFANRLQRRLDQSTQPLDSQQLLPNSITSSRASYLHIQLSTILNAAATFPPHEVAKFLIAMFFEYGQTNYFYVDEVSLRQKIARFYEPERSLLIEDAAWLCMLLMTFAVGSQFAHLSSREEQEQNPQGMGTNLETQHSSDDTIAQGFYQAAATLIPATISLASMDSVQAFLLLGVYTLPIDATALSSTYLGIAIRIAIQNGMHHGHPKRMMQTTVETRNRIWWTAYTLEKRICVMHGLPVSISDNEVDAPQPTDLPHLRPTERIDTLPNVLAMIKLTSILENAKTNMSDLGNTARKRSNLRLDSILQIRQSLYEYWQSLPMNIYCRDLDANGSLFRSNIHLALTYHLAHVFIGRNFMFVTCNRKPPQPSAVVTSTSLVSSCMDSAIEIVELCQRLQDELGLARASYTEFTSCRAAVLAILAQRLQEQSVRLRQVFRQGMGLLRDMSLSFHSADGESLQLEAIESAARRMDTQSRAKKARGGKQSMTTDSAYDRFRSWAQLWTDEDPGLSASFSSQQSIYPTENQKLTEPWNFSNPSPLQDLGWDFVFPSSSFDLIDESVFDIDGF